MRSLEVAADEFDDDALDGEGLVWGDDHWGGGWVVAAEDDDAVAVLHFDGNAFEGGLAIHEAGADLPGDEGGVDVGSVVDEDDVVGFEGWFHGVKTEAEAVAVGGPQVSEDGEHFELFLGVGWFACGDGAIEWEFARVEGLGGVVFVSCADEDGFGDVEGDGEGVEGALPGGAFVAFEG